ncbi:30S ribosomal protein S15 [Candidatus Micrarchaeota archaeon]|nr:30S ribosomal protein S15 [Candidatus Micrarchaeota archaeon]
MARLHSRKKGKSGSKRHAVLKFKKSTKMPKDEIISLVEKLAKEGKQPEAIGQELKAQGVPSVKAATGKTITQVLKEKEVTQEYPSDLLNLIKRAVRVRKHLKENKTDTSNKVKLTHVESKIKRLVRYYRGNKLPQNWKYDPEEATLLVK